MGGGVSDEYALERHRRSIRLQGYDYSQPGAYFITIVSQDRACLFGDVVDEQVILNDAGEMVARWCTQLEQKHQGYSCDAFTCMPNHVHFILFINSHRDSIAPRCTRMFL
jgi:putative transposase